MRVGLFTSTMERRWYTRRVEGVNTPLDRQFGIAEHSLLHVEHGVGFGDSVPHWPPNSLDCPATCLHALHHSPDPAYATIADDLHIISRFVLRERQSTDVAPFVSQAANDVVSLNENPPCQISSGIAVKKPSRQASSPLNLPTSQTSPGTGDTAHRSVDQQRGRTISTTTPIRSRLFAHFNTCQGIEKKRETFTPGGCNLPQSHAVPDAEDELNVAVEYPHCCYHHDKPRGHVHPQQQPTSVCQKREPSRNCISNVCFHRSK